MAHFTKVLELSQDIKQWTVVKTSRMRSILWSIFAATYMICITLAHIVTILMQLFYFVQETTYYCIKENIWWKNE